VQYGDKEMRKALTEFIYSITEKKNGRFNYWKIIRDFKYEVTDLIIIESDFLKANKIDPNSSYDKLLPPDWILRQFSADLIATKTVKIGGLDNYIPVFSTIIDRGLFPQNIVSFEFNVPNMLISKMPGLVEFIGKLKKNCPVLKVILIETETTMNFNGSRLEEVKASDFVAKAK